MPPLPPEFPIVVLVVGAFIILVARLTSIHRRLDRVSRLEAKIDALLKGAGVTFDPYQDIPADVRGAIERGQKIEAIKHYRLATGAGLKEAKEFVEEVQRRRPGASQFAP